MPDNEDIKISAELQDLFVQRVTDWARQSISSEYGLWNNILGNALVNDCQSPIEQVMLVELLFAFDQWDRVNIRDHGMELHLGHGLFDRDTASISLTPQFPEDKYSIDLAVHVRGPSGEVMKIAIECDGHDFHERTKEQARHDRQRDRFLQQRGWLVFRFTGSEIYRDSRKCAREVGQHVLKWQMELLRARFPKADETP